jgi:hypothetical protein
LHITIRPRGEQPWVLLILKGKTEKDDSTRNKEMETYKKYNVHVVYQKSAWFDGFVAANAYAPFLKKDLERVGMEGDTFLLLSDNLGAQRVDAFRQEIERLNGKTMYGPKNGTHCWQPVDHGIGHVYQERIARKSDEWNKSSEARGHFRENTMPSAARRRELMCQWVYEVWSELEDERKQKEAMGEKSMFEMAFLRTGMLISRDGGDVDDKIDPEGMSDVIENSSDSFYKDHKIQKFIDLVKFQECDCGHVEPPAPPPTISVQDKQADEALVKTRFQKLTECTDPRAQLIVKCLAHGMLWAGSSFTVFMGGGVEALLDFLNERGENNKPAHDVDLYPTSDDVQALGARFVTKRCMRS